MKVSHYKRGCFFYFQVKISQHKTLFSILIIELLISDNSEEQERTLVQNARNPFPMTLLIPES